ncbi:MAG TPA: tetratricopeptide repeat protein [Oceanobacillus sp.]|nr:tetratricopeptide repeat protein [Oceanobacillus sp.]
MRRICSTLFVILLLALPLTAQAQEPSTDDVLERAEAAAAAAREHAEDAARYAGDASNFLGIFEAISVAITIAIGALGVVGVTRLFSAQNALTEARKRVNEELDTLRKEFEDEIERRRKELIELNDLLRQSAEQQKRESARATLALSLLPLGERQYRAQDLKGAYETYLRALELDGNNPVIHYRLGYVAVQSDHFEDAERHLKRALEIDPDFALAKAALGFTYRRMTDSMSDSPERDLLYNKAENCFLEALQKSPKLVDDDGESWWGSLGGLYRRRGQMEQAIKAYERAAEVTPHSSYPFSNLALLYMGTQDRESMMKMYKRVERIALAETQAEVDNYWAYADVLTARLALGKTQDTEDLLTIMFEIAPKESNYPLESLANTLERLMNALGGASAAPQIPPYIERIRKELETRRQQQPA